MEIEGRLLDAVNIFLNNQHQATRVYEKTKKAISCSNNLSLHQFQIRFLINQNY
jgi:hypothetical protein